MYAIRRTCGPPTPGTKEITSTIMLLSKSSVRAAMRPQAARGSSLAPSMRSVRPARLIPARASSPGSGGLAPEELAKKANEVAAQLKVRCQ